MARRAATFPPAVPRSTIAPGAGAVRPGGERRRRIGVNTKELFSFPDPVNEVAARVVATGVLLLALLTLAARRPWLLVPLAYGFVARALTGPTLSPLGQLATHVIAPRLPVPARPVAGPPKRFAQALGAVVSVSAALLALVFRRTTAAYIIVALMV